MIQEIIVYLIGLSIVVLLAYKLIKAIFWKSDASKICANCCHKSNHANYYYKQKRP